MPYDYSELDKQYGVAPSTAKKMPAATPVATEPEQHDYSELDKKYLNPVAPVGSTPSYQAAQAPAPYESPYKDRPIPKSIFDVSTIADNTAKGFESIGKVGATLSGLATLRAREVLLDAASGMPIFTPDTQKTMRERGGPLFRRKDLDDLGTTIKGGIDYIGEEYVKPFAKGPIDATTPSKNPGKKFSPELMFLEMSRLRDEPKTPSYANYLLQHAGKAPVETFLDALPVGVGAAKSMTSIIKHEAGLAPTLAAGLSATGKAMEPAMSHIPDWLALSMLPQWAQKLTPAGKAKQMLAAALKDVDAKRLAGFLQAKQALDEAFEGLTPQERKLLTAYGEKTDNRILGELAKLNKSDPKMVSTKMAAYERAIAAVRHYNRTFVETFKIPDDIHAHAVYVPKLLAEAHKAQMQEIGRLVNLYKKADTPARKDFIRAQIQDASLKVRRNGGRLNAQDFIDNPELAEKLMDQAHSDKRAGIPAPIHAPIATRIQVAKAFEKATTQPLGGITGKTMNVAKKVGKGEVETPYALDTDELPGYLQSRSGTKARTTPVSDLSGSEEHAYIRAQAKLEKMRQELDVLNVNKLGGLAKKQKLEAEIQKIENINWRKYRQSGSNWKNTVTNVRTAKHELDLKKLTLANEHNRLRYQAIVELTQKVIDMAGEEGAVTKKGWEAVDLKKEVVERLKHDGMPTSGAERFFDKQAGTTVSLPKNMAHQLRESIHGPGPIPPQLAWLAIPGKAYNKLLFAMDPSFELRLMLQTGGIQVGMQRSPKDVMTLFASHLIAMNPKAREAFPASVIMSHTSHGGGIEAIKIADNWIEKMQQAAQKVLDLKGHIGYEVIHNTQRRASAIQFLLYRSKDAPPTIKRLFADVLHHDETLMEAAEGTFDPEKLKALHDFLKPMGDYSPGATLRRRYVNLFIPVSAWAAHALDIIKTMPFRYPQKTATISYLQAIVDQYEADKYGRLPIKNRNGNRALSEGGRTMRSGGPSLDNLESGMKMVHDMGEIAFSTLGLATGAKRTAYGKLKIPSGINPVLSTAASWMTGVDFSSGIPYAEVNQAVKKKFTKDGVVYRDKETGEEYNTQTSFLGPNPAMVALRNLAPKQTKQFQSLLAGENEPSMFTAPGNPAPRTKRGHPIKADSVERALGMFGWGAHQE